SASRVSPTPPTPPEVYTLSLHDALPISGMHSKTIVAFPCHHSEVVGDESEKTIKLIRNKVVSTVNWKRDIAPRIYFWFRNEGLRSEEHTSELQSRENLVCRLLLEKKTER